MLRLLVARLRERGHDVRWIFEERRGIADPQVLAEALEAHKSHWAGHFGVIQKHRVRLTVLPT